jgi:hypothetical protein
MTEREALQEFRAEVLPEVEARYPNDKPAQRQAWVGFIDALARDGRISERQAASWGNPF